MTEEKKEDQIPLTDVTVQLVGVDGNAFNVLGKVRAELRRAGYDNDFIERFTTEATSGDYNHLLAVVCKYVIVE